MRPERRKDPKTPLLSATVLITAVSVGFGLTLAGFFANLFGTIIQNELFHQIGIIARISAIAPLACGLFIILDASDPAFRGRHARWRLEFGGIFSLFILAMNFLFLPGLLK